MKSVIILVLVSAASLHAALIGPPAVAGRSARVTLCATSSERAEAAVDVADVASHVRKGLDLELVETFVAATERGLTSAAMALCTEDFIYKTHSATTHSLAEAEERFATKVPVPTAVTKDFHEEHRDVIVREVVVKPVPFVTVTVRQEFELRSVGGGKRLCRAEYIKL